MMILECGDLFSGSWVNAQMGCLKFATWIRRIEVFSSQRIF
jgi:hypothetical protein